MCCIDFSPSLRTLSVALIAMLSGSQRLSCCYNPSCMAWQYDGNRACLWGDSTSVCSGSSSGANGSAGGFRSHFQPPKLDYEFAQAGHDDSG